jgi:DNA-binding transcriptional MocR family regulator
MGQLDWANTISLDRGSREGLADQLSAAIEARIATGLLDTGDRLPTTRDLASALDINRGTVQAAYRRLAERGLVEGRVGSGTVVVGGGPATAPGPAAAFDPLSLLSHRAAAIVSDTPRPPTEPSVADFSRLTPDERFFPLEEFTVTLAAAWSRRRDLWQYASRSSARRSRGASRTPESTAPPTRSS